MRYFLLTIGLTLVVAGSASGATYIVRPDGTGDFPTIQAAVWAAADGDTILLTDGTFTGWENRNVDFIGLAIVIESQGGNPEACIIDCEGTPGEVRRGFDLHSGEGPGAILRGITITRGLADGGCGTLRGGAISCSNEASPTIENCVFLDNETAWGGALYCHTASPNLTGCTFRANKAWSRGGAAYCDFLAAPTFTNCTLKTNNTDGLGGAIFAVPGSQLSLVGCQLIGNAAGGGDGGACRCRGALVAVSGCVFTGNSTAGSGGAVACWDCSTLVAGCAFTSNSAFGSISGFGAGGAVLLQGNLQGNSSPLISECEFSGNVIHSATPICMGGAVACWIRCMPTFQSCTFTGNTADGPTSSGGGVCSDSDGAPTFENCVFSGNAAAWGGGWPILTRLRWPRSSVVSSRATVLSRAVRWSYGIVLPTSRTALSVTTRPRRGAGYGAMPAHPVNWITRSSPSARRVRRWGATVALP